VGLIIAESLIKLTAEIKKLKLKKMGGKNEIYA